MIFDLSGKMCAKRVLHCDSCFFQRGSLSFSH